MLLDSWHTALSAAAASPAAGPSSTRGAAQLPNDHPRVPAFDSLSPPPGCPMHKADGGPTSLPTRRPMGASGPSSSQRSLANAAAAFSSDSSSSSSSSSSAAAAAAAAAAAPPPRSWSETLNPLNMMPFLSNSRASEKQKVVLPTERVVSSIPRSATSPGPGASPYDKVSSSSPPSSSSAEASSSSSSAGPAKCPVDHGRASAGAQQQGQQQEEADNKYWEYPSPQQFYNALLRKGWETPEEHVEMMVLIHNWLNEAAWQEVLDWERRAGVDPNKVELARFQGKPGTLSPKARVYNFLGQIMPSRFQSEPPFDRHDWIVRRPAPPGSSAAPQEVRYIIDYYSVPETEQENAADEPEFVLDIRPALDNVGSAWVRIQKTWDDYAAASNAAGGGGGGGASAPAASASAAN